MLRGRPISVHAIVLTFKQFGSHGKSKCRGIRLISLGFKQLARPLHASLSWRRILTNSGGASLAAATIVRIRLDVKG
jgi:hypothetical protein